jgi:DNA-binding beta-propeller fold protein YncE
MPKPHPLRVSPFLVFLLGLAWAAAAPAQASYQLFEAGQVRPIALSPDGSQLFAVNTPDNHLEIFDVDGSGLLTFAASVPVGMEPVAVAARSNDEVWVVNHLSDSVSIVSLTPSPRVVRTLLVGDEPRDLVFAGSGGDRAFITTAHRGQQLDRVLSLAGDPRCATLGEPSCFATGTCSCSQPGTPGVGRADVWVFDAASPGSSLGGDPLSIVNLFGDRPRALAVNSSGSRVYAAVFRSGNQTTVVNEGLVCDTGNFGSSSAAGPCNANGVTIPGGTPPPHRNQAGANRPETGLILKRDRPGAPAGVWSDELGRNWNAVVKFDLPDRDVFEIDADASPPAAIDASSSCADGSGCWADIGTTLFNMAVNPVSGKIYVSNSDAQNHVRFEGPGSHAAGAKPGGEPATVQGDLARMRITVLDGANVLPRHLNKHIDYGLLPAPAGTADDSLSTPLAMAVTPDGSTLYVAAFGSGKVGRFDTAQLEADTFTPGAADHIAVGGGGPSGLVLAGDLLYVLSRFDDSVRVVHRLTGAELQAVALHTPEPPEVVAGRPFLYGADLTSSNGEASCASCHIFGDMDDLAWDLGNPDDVVVANGNPFNPLVPIAFDPVAREFHPMKGPMTTQSLRGLVTLGAQHWRGDRQGDGDANADEEVDAVLAFEAFNAAFPGLIGRAGQLLPAEMTAFRKFALELRYPPNPNRRIDNNLRAHEAAGAGLYLGPITDTVANCNGCHVLNSASGSFGGDGQTIFDGETQHMKIPHLRNQYQKVGMFGMSEPDSALLNFTGDFSHQGPQIRGFGFLHDGSVDSLARFFGLTGFSMNATQEAQMEAFMLAFDTDLAPAVGQQVTLTSSNASQANPRIDLLLARAGTGFVSRVLGGSTTECELIAKVVEGGSASGYLFDPGSALFLPDDGGAGIGDAALRAVAVVAGQEVTYTCVPPGSGQRMGRDRDADLLLDGVETNTGVFVGAGDTGTDPAKADSDGDGFSDGAEVANFPPTDPNDPLDFPGPPQGVPSLARAGLVSLFLGMGFAALPLLRRRGSH